MGLEGTTVKFKKGQSIIEEGQPSRFLYIVKQGQVEVFRKSKEKKIPLAVVNSGQYLGEIAVLSGKAHAANATALSDCELLRFTKETMEAQLNKLPSWVMGLLRNLSMRLSTTNEILRRNGIVDESLHQAITAVLDQD